MLCDNMFMKEIRLNCYFYQLTLHTDSLLEKPLLAIILLYSVILHNIGVGNQNIF